VNAREQLEPFASYLRDGFPALAHVLWSAEVSADEAVTAELLAPLVTAACDARAGIAVNAVWVLWVLTADSTAARSAVAGMARHKQSHIRNNAMASVSKLAPLGFKREVIERGLRDRTGRVREKAADRALSLCLREVIPELESAVASERNAGTKRGLEFTLKLLRDGYFVTPADDDEVQVTIAFDGGVGGCFVPRDELESRGAEAVVAQWLADEGHEPPNRGL
jgi:hypothetical protein